MEEIKKNLVALWKGLSGQKKVSLIATFLLSLAVLGAQGTEPATSSVAATGGANPTTWGHMVQQMVMDVNNKQSDANALVTDVLKGGPTPVHEAMVATEESTLAFEFLAEMRNKVVESYQTVMQMQV